MCCQAEQDAEKQSENLQGSMQDEVESVQAALDTATQSLAQAKAALAVQQQDHKRAMQTSASLKVSPLFDQQYAAHCSCNGLRPSLPDVFHQSY